MLSAKNLGIRIIITLLLLLGLMYMPAPAFSQQPAEPQNLIQNGGFEAGFQPGQGVANGWASFNNGNALVGWSAETWDQVVAEGSSAQLIEIKNATEQDRFAGIYQTIQVVPNQQYRLTIKGLIRSTEGHIEASDYGYRLQYAIDHSGKTAWELLDETAWQELPWDEQVLDQSAEATLQIDTFNATITTESERLTLYIRGWKKWINNGSGLYDLDEISLVGPAPESFAAPVAQTVALESSTDPSKDDLVLADVALQSEHDEDLPVTESEDNSAPAESNESNNSEAETADEADNEEETSQDEESSESAAPAQTLDQQLPESGQGQDETINYMMIAGGAILLLLLVSAIVNAVRRRQYS